MTHLDMWGILGIAALFFTIGWGCGQAIAFYLADKWRKEFMEERKK